MTPFHPPAELPSEQREVIARAESLGIDTLGYATLNSRWRENLLPLIAKEQREREAAIRRAGSEPEETDDTGFLPSGGTDLTVNYVDQAMFTAEEMQADAVARPRVYLVSATPDPLGTIAAACRMYEGKATYSLNDVSDEERRHYWEQVQKTHLKAPLEFVDLHFFIEGVTRAFTHQMVRQRTAVYAQESMRFAVKEDIAARPGPMIANSPDLVEQWEEVVDSIWDGYKALINMGVPAEEARGLLPHDTLTRLNYKTNLRNLIDHAGNRLCTQAQFEWRAVFAEIVQAIGSYRADGRETAVSEEGEKYDLAGGWQFRYIAETNVFKPVCYQLGHCPFTADFDRGCTIRERVQANEFDKIDDREWLFDPTAGITRREEG